MIELSNICLTISVFKDKYDIYLIINIKKVPKYGSYILQFIFKLNRVQYSKTFTAIYTLIILCKREASIWTML